MILTQEEYNVIQLNNCTKKNNELICILKKNEIEENLILNENILYLELYYFYFFKSITLGPISKINIIDNTVKKENIYVLITKLAENNLNKDDNIILETNVTSVSNLITDFFFLNTDKTSNICYLKKTEKTPLIIFCSTSVKEQGTFSLGLMEDYLILKYHHIKYNFYIKRVNLSEEFTISGYGASAISTSPTLLDFTNSNDNIAIHYTLVNVGYKELRLKLNPDSPKYLDCDKLNKLNDGFVYKCLVNRSHFENKENGYYYTYHENYENTRYIR